MVDLSIPPGPQEPDVLARARVAYPFINKFNPAAVVNINHPNREGHYAETFGPDEPGYGEYPRPAGVPKGQTVIEIYRPDKFSEKDLAAEFLHVDPAAHEARNALMGTFNNRQLKILQGEPDYTKSIEMKLTPQRAMENVTDALMRGYTVGQWPEKAIKSFGLDERQTGILEGLRKYMTTESAPDAQ